MLKDQLIKIQIEAFKDELNKLSSLKEGKKYLSIDKKFYDAANDCETEDLDAATNYSPAYKTDHMSIKTAGEKFVAQYLVGKNVDGRVRRIPKHTVNQTQPIGYRPPMGDISHGDGVPRGYDYGVNS
jgi:hypothetical protein